MHIIRDGGPFDLVTAGLCIDWGLKRCNLAGCRNWPNTIIQGAAPEVPLFALCEEHYQKFHAPGGIDMDLEFDDYNAFAEITEAFSDGMGWDG